jgi:hypothetical protein
MDSRVLGPLEVLDGGGTSLKLLATPTVHDVVALSGVAFEERGAVALPGASREWRLFAVTRQYQPHLPAVYSKYPWR